MCNCRSYNKQAGEDPEKIIKNPFTDCKVSIDRCISHIIEDLWSAGIPTEGSCCGHGELNPSIILSIGTSETFIKLAKNIIKESDDRDVNLMMWELKAI